MVVTDNLLNSRQEAVLAVSTLFEEKLNRPPTSNIIDLWKEHLCIRETLKLVSERQSQLSTTDKDVAVERSQDSLAAFLGWAKQIGVKCNGVEVVACPDVKGFGLKSIGSHSKDESLVSVPRHAMISSDLARKSAMLKKAFERDPIVQSMDNVGLALFLCGQRLKSDSKWLSYLNILPNSFSTPLFYTEEELLNLKPSPLFEETLLFFRTVSRQYCYFYLQVSKNDLYDKMRKRKATNEAPPPFYNTPFTVDNFTFSLYRWAVCCVTTRINMVPSETDKNKDGSPRLIPALIPVLDMANHELSLEADDNPVSYSTETDSAEIHAARALSEGDAVTIYYGIRSNADHLLHNGFVPAGENPHDRYKLKIAIPRNAKHFEEKMKLIFDLGFNGFSQSNIFVYDVSNGAEPFHPTLETFAKVYVTEKPDKKVLESPDTLKKAVQFLKNRFALLERSYGEVEDVGGANGKNIERLKRAELSILTNARTYCEEWEKKLE